MSKKNYKFLYFSALSLLQGLKEGMNTRFRSCEECDFVQKYLDYSLNMLEDLEKGE